MKSPDVFSERTVDSARRGVAEPVRRGVLSARAIDTLRRAVSDGFANVSLLKTESDLDALRKDPAFKIFLSDLVFADTPFANAE